MKRLPLHREWAITAGTVRDDIDQAKAERLEEAYGLFKAGKHREWNKVLLEIRWTPKLRHQLAKYSEFPLDEVKGYGFEFTPARPGRAHPFLLFARADIDRVR